MEGLSAAASVIAVMQLAESFKKLYDFWNSIKEAPEDIRTISVDMHNLSNILSQIANETQHVEPDTTLIAALNGCCVKVKTLNTLLNDIEPGFASKRYRVRQWTALKAVLKHGELMKYQVALDRLKIDLLLVQQYQYSRWSRIRHNSLEATIAQNFTRLSAQKYLEIAESSPSVASNALRAEEQDARYLYPGNVYLAQTGPPNSGENWIVPQGKAMVRRTLEVSESVIEGFLGSIRAKSATVLQSPKQTADLTPYREQDQHEYKTSYTISPAPWLVRLGFHYGLHLGFLSSTQGWKNTLKTFCPVPDDALIFEFCRQGNVSAVRSLLLGGYASVRDTDSRGYTPLHFAAENYRSELCRFLKSAGADIATLTHDEKTPIRLAARHIEKFSHITGSEVFDTFRHLVDSMDFSEEDGDGWEVMKGLSTASDGYVAAKVLIWMLRLLNFELKTNFVERHFAHMLSSMLLYASNPEKFEASDLLLNLGGHRIINALEGVTHGYAVLHEAMIYTMGEDNVSALAARGPDLHLRAFDTFYTPFEESPTSLAMYSSNKFSHWLRALADVDVDLEKFIDQELELNPEVHAGWEKETLLELFAHDNRPDLDHRRVWTCSDCLWNYFPFGVQPYWRHLLERIKERKHPYDPVSAVSEFDEDDNVDFGSLGEATCGSTDLTPALDTTGNDTLFNPNEVPAEEVSDSEADASDNSATTPIGSVCLYGKLEIVCMECWLHYTRTGSRRQPARNESLSKNEDSSSSDESSECEYSPYLIHS